MLFYVGALVAGVLRWPWWTAAILVVARCLWGLYVDLPGWNAFRSTFGEPPLGFDDEVILISIATSSLVIVVAYAVGVGVRAVWERARRV